MRNIIIFFLILLPALLTAQSREVVLDSTWISNENGLFFENHITVFNTGEEEGGYKRLLGDTVKVLDKFANRIEQAASRFANDATVIVQYPAKIRELIRQDADVEDMLSLSPIKTIQDKYSARFTDTTWQVRSGSDILDIVFFVNGAGNLRYTLDTFPTKTAILLGDIIRLNNYQDGTFDPILYRIGDNVFSSIDKSIILRMSGSGNKNRSAAQPVEAPAESSGRTMPDPKPDRKLRIFKKKSKQ